MKKVLIIFLLAVLGVSSGCSLNFLNKTVTSPLETAQDGLADQESQQPIETETQPQISPYAISFSWEDLQNDVLSPQGLVTDGKPDGYFQVAMNFPEPVKIKYIIMRYQEFNAHVQWAWAYNKTLTTVGSPIAVFQKETLVLQGTDIGFECSGDTNLALYIPELDNENGRDTFKFANNQKISIQINYITKSGEQHQLNSTTLVKMLEM
jgi:hypothetical protein